MIDYGITDTHVHLWDLSRLRYPWIDGNETLDRTYLPTDYWGAHGSVTVDRIVFIQAACLPEQEEREAEWVLGLAEDEPRIAGVVPTAPIELGDAVERRLERLAANPRVKGIRRLLSPEDEPEFCLQPAFLAGLRLLPGLGLSFDICIANKQLGDVVRMVRACPEVEFILDHVGAPDIRNGAMEPWRTLMREMGALPNVVCKMSGIVSFADTETQGRTDFRPYADHVLESFGPDKVMYASDWPVLAAGWPGLKGMAYPDWVETVQWFAEDLSESEQRKLFVENAERVYKLGA